MTYLRRLTFISGWVAAIALAGGCGAHLKSPLVTEPLPIHKVRGAGKSKNMSRYSGTQTRYFRGHDSLPPFSKVVQLEAMVFRSLLDDPSDQTTDARKDEKRVDCAEGRANLDFIDSIAVGVRKSDQEDKDAVIVATYQRTEKGLCGLRLTPTYADIKEYIEDYVFVIKVTGTLPPQPVSLSGYYSVQDYEGL